MTPSRSGPTSGSLPWRAISLMRPASSSTFCACPTMRSPAGVVVTSLVRRSKICVPSSSSSFLIATDSVGWLTKQASAARPKWRSRATATMYLSSVRVMPANRNCASCRKKVVPSFVPAPHVFAGGLLILREQRLGGLTGLLDESCVAPEVREAQQRYAGLACAEELAGSAHHKVAPRHLETIAGLVYDFQALARGFGQRLFEEQDAVALLRATADAAPQLMELCEAEALGVLDDHQGRVGNVDPDLDHRRGHQHVDLPGNKILHHAGFLRSCELAVQQPDTQPGQQFVDVHMRFGRRGGLDRIACLDQWTNPVGLASGRDVRTDAIDDFLAPPRGHQLRDDRPSAGRQLVDDGNIEIGEIAHRERARYRRGRQHQHVRRQLLPGIAQREPLGNAEAMLLIDDGETQPLEADGLLDQGVRSDHQLGGA